MKKYFLVIYSVLNFAINFVCFWFSDLLFDRFFVFGLIPVLFSLILLVVLSILIIRAIQKNKDMKSYIATVVCIVTITTIVFFPFRMAKVKTELLLLEEERFEIFEMLKENKIEISNTGLAELPEGYGHMSSDGTMMVYQNDEEQVVGFWVFRGLLSGSVVLIYTSAEEELIYKNETAHKITKIEKLKDHWYLINTD